MKKIAFLFAFIVAFCLSLSAARAQTIPQLLPNSQWCVGNGAPGTDQVTLIATLPPPKHGPNTSPTYCVTIDVGTFSNPYIVNDLSVYGWDNDYHINTIWNGPTSEGDYWTGVNLTGTFMAPGYNLRYDGLQSAHFASMKAFHF